MERIVKSHYITVVLALTILIGVGVSANAEERPELVVNVPHEFVVGSATLPAGKYVVSRLSDDRLGGLSIGSYDNDASAFFLASEFQNQLTNDAKVTFEQVGDVYFLHTIATAEGVYTVPSSRVLVSAAAMKHRDTMTPSGAN